MSKIQSALLGVVDSRLTTAPSVPTCARYVRRLEDPLPPLEQLPVVSEHRPLKKERLGAPDYPSETTKGPQLSRAE